NNLGSSYYHGRGVARDWREAARWWELAAEQGCEPAIRNLAMLSSSQPSSGFQPLPPSQVAEIERERYETERKHWEDRNQRQQAEMRRAAAQYQNQNRLQSLPNGPLGAGGVR